MKVTVNELQAKVMADGIDVFGTFAGCIENGWFDWFCADTSLKGRTKKFIPILKGLKPGGKIGFGRRVYFKNNYACYYSKLYDDIRFAYEDGSSEYVVTCDCPFAKSKWAVYHESNGFEKPVAEFDRVEKLVSWLND